MKPGLNQGGVGGHFININIITLTLTFLMKPGLNQGGGGRLLQSSDYTSPEQPDLGSSVEKESG